MEVNKNFSEKASEDYKLVSAALKGEQSAYSSLMNRYREAIFYLILKMVRNEIEAEDLAIETFEKAFAKLDQYSPSYAFSTWIFRIATNHTIDFIRKKRLKTTSIDDEMNGPDNQFQGIQIKTTSKDPEEKYIEQQKIELMHSVVDKLDEPYKSLVQLRYFDELSYDEIAEKREMPLGTVKAQLFRARSLLADLMRKSRRAI